MEDDEWGEVAETWEENDAVKQYSEKAFAVISKECTSLKGMKILDVGCGTGLLTRLLAPLCAQVVALEPSPKMMEVCKKKTKIENVSFALGCIDPNFVQGNLQAFDLIVASSVCAFIPDYLELLNFVSRLLKPGGKFLQFDWHFAESTLENHEKGFSEATIRSAIEKTPLLVSTYIGPVFTMELQGEEDAAVVIGALTVRDREF